MVNAILVAWIDLAALDWVRALIAAVAEVWSANLIAFVFPADAVQVVLEGGIGAVWVDTTAHAILRAIDLTLINNALKHWC